MTLARGKKLHNNRYTIEQELGRGGFGVTYKAWDSQENKIVVIKVVHDYFQSTDEYQNYLRRFKREIAILQNLKTNYQLNSHILEWYDSFVEKIGDRNVDCLVTEFIPGNNLYNFIHIQDILTEAQVVKIAHQIGSALQILHNENFNQSENLVHRDVHPGNIILRDNGDAVLIDFGLSRKITDHDHSMLTIAGNPKFAPCEQMISGSSKPTVDIYSLAATLYYALTKKCPPHYIERYENHDWFKCSDSLPGISEQLKAAILKGLEFKPENRPQSIEAWLNLLPKPEQFISTQPINNILSEISVVEIKAKSTSKKLVVYSFLTTIAMFGLGFWGFFSQQTSQSQIDELNQDYQQKVTNYKQQVANYEQEIQDLKQEYRNLNIQERRDQSILDSIRERGNLICGIDGNIPGFSDVNSQGVYSGLDVDICKAVAAAIFADPTNKINYEQVDTDERFAKLKQGYIDILTSNTTWTLGRDFQKGVEFAPIIFYDQQRIMVRKDSGIERLEDFQDQKICVEKGTTAQTNIKAIIEEKNLQVEIKLGKFPDATYELYYDGDCQGIIADQSQLITKTIEEENISNHTLLELDQTLSKEPLAPVVIENDPNWFDVVQWTIFALIEAEELGITQDNVESMQESEDLRVRCFLGVDNNCNFGESLGLSNDFAARIIKDVGNYGEIYKRNLGEYELLKDRGNNQLHRDGGLLYSPPFL